MVIKLGKFNDLMLPENNGNTKKGKLYVLEESRKGLMGGVSS